MEKNNINIDLNAKTKSKEERNVPNLRFAEFVKEYKKTSLNNLTLIYDGTHQTPNYQASGVPFVSVEDISNLNETTKYISYEDFKINFKAYPKYGDVLMTRIGSIGVPTIIVDNIQRGYYVSLALLRPKGNLNGDYLKFIIESPSFQHELWKRTIHVAFPKKINKDDIGKCSLYYCDIEEQNKIAKILNKIGERIYTQIKIISAYESYINKLKEQILIRFSNSMTLTISDVCAITTGKLDANAMKENGKYRFYTCAENYYFIDEYAFDTEALLISGNGANVGYIHYYKGKFNAYQRTYVLSDFKVNPSILKLNLDVNLKKRINEQKNIGNTPYIKIDTISKMKLFLPNKDDEYKFIKIIHLTEQKIENEQKILDFFKKQKSFLLNNLFI